MPMNSKKRSSTDLSAIIEGLMKADVKFILVGGLAAVVQGAPVTTMDVDIVPHRSPENVSKLYSFLTSVEAIYRRPDSKIVTPKEKDLLEMGHAFFTTRIGPIDVLAYIEKGKTYEDLFKHTVEIMFRDRPLYVLGIKMLIELKRSSRDPKDKQRLPVLEETLLQLEQTSDIATKNRK